MASTGDDTDTTGTGINGLGEHEVSLTFSEEKTISEITFIQRSSTCCLDRVNDYNIILYNGTTIVANYYQNNSNRLFCENRLRNDETTICSYSAGAAINFHLDSNDKEIFGLNSPQKVTKIKIIRTRTSLFFGAISYGVGAVSIGFNEIIIRVMCRRP